MFEFDKYDALIPGVRSNPDQAYSYFEGGHKRALLLWSEHCVECAAPDCFTTCDLYKARPDERCRRFQYGMYKNKSYHSAAGCGAEVIFRRWGKLEARGNAYLFPWRLSFTIERILYTLLPGLNFFGKVIRKSGASIRWSYISFGVLERLNRLLLKKQRKSESPNVFLIEIYNPEKKIHKISFFIGIDLSQLAKNYLVDELPRPYVQQLSLKPGYSRIEVPVFEFKDILDSGLPFGIAFTPECEDGVHLVFLELNLVQLHQAPSFIKDSCISDTVSIARASKVKCVVFDLDNTIWDGVLLEGNVELRAGVKELFEKLDERGILVSIASKNSYSDAMEKLSEYGLSEYILYPMINWDQKSNSVKNISKKISIGLDTFLFIDDNMFEREEVARAHPEVEVVSDTALAGLLDRDRLQGGGTKESGQRRIMYQQEMEREQIAISFGEDYLKFLKDSEIVVEIMPVTQEHLNRVVELVQRTNQLNFSGRKYLREEILEIIEGPEFNKHVLSCKDKFGSYGIVGFALTRVTDGGVLVEDFMLSCRVQGKFIEQAFFHHLITNINPSAEFISVNFHKTERNVLAAVVLEKIGFTLEENQLAHLDVIPGMLDINFLEVKVHRAD